MHGMADNIDSMVCNRFIPLCQFQELSSISDRVVGTRKLKGCINVDGTVARRPMEH